MKQPQSISRRELLRGRFLGGLFDRARQSISDVEPTAGETSNNKSDTPLPPSPRHSRSFPILRPPGAIEEEAFLDGCTKCDACLKACPHQAIVHAPPRFRSAAGTPMIDPVQQPCMMCNEFPCIFACEPNVLQMAMSKRMGEASIDVFSCLAHTGSFCTVCSEQCPVENAIEIINGKPRINAQHCTGCSVCQYVCPAPHNAILLMPLAQRSTPVAIVQGDQPCRT